MESSILITRLKLIRLRGRSQVNPAEGAPDLLDGVPAVLQHGLRLTQRR